MQEQDKEGSGERKLRAVSGEEGERIYLAIGTERIFLQIKVE